MSQKLNIKKHLLFPILTAVMCGFRFTSENKWPSNYEEQVSRITEKKEFYGPIT